MLKKHYCTKYNFLRRKVSVYPVAATAQKSCVLSTKILCLQLQIEGDWNLIEYYTSFDGKPFPPHSPYLCPESRMVFNPDVEGSKMNISQVK